MMVLMLNFRRKIQITLQVSIFIFRILRQHKTTRYHLHNNSENNGNLKIVSVSRVNFRGDDEGRNQRDDGDDEKNKNENIVNLVPDLLPDGLLFLFGELVLSVRFKSGLGFLAGKSNLTDVGGDIKFLDDLLLGHGVPERRIHDGSLLWGRHGG